MVLGTVGQVVLGGALIGLAFAMLRIMTGRLMSTSGMIGSLLGGREGPAAVSMAFIAGLFVAPSVLGTMGFVTQPPVEAGWPLLLVGGLMVGIGARLGNSSVVGSVFGLTQGSKRAVVAIVAIISGAVVSVILAQVLGTGGAA